MKDDHRRTGKMEMTFYILIEFRDISIYNKQNLNSEKHTCQGNLIGCSKNMEERVRERGKKRERNVNIIKGMIGLRKVYLT